MLNQSAHVTHFCRAVIEYRRVTSQQVIGMETSSKPFLAAQVSVISTVDNTSTQLQPTA